MYGNGRRTLCPGQDKTQRSSVGSLTFSGAMKRGANTQPVKKSPIQNHPYHHHRHHPAMMACTNNYWLREMAWWWRGRRRWWWWCRGTAQQQPSNIIISSSSSSFCEPVYFLACCYIVVWGCVRPSSHLLNSITSHQCDLHQPLALRCAVEENLLFFQEPKCAHTFKV